MCVCEGKRERGDEELGRGVVGDSTAHKLDDSMDKYNANRILHHVVRQSLDHCGNWRLTIADSVSHIKSCMLSQSESASKFIETALYFPCCVSTN